MAKVEYIKPIESLHGKLQKKDKVGYARRQSENAQGVKVKFTVTYGKRNLSTNPYSTDEVAQHTRFAAVAAAVAARRVNPSKISQDKAAFAAAKDTYKTMTRYLWAKELATYDAAHPQS